MANPTLNNSNISSGPLHQVIVRPTQLVPVLPATTPSVLKRVIPPPTTISTIVPHTTSQIIIKQESLQMDNQYVINEPETNVPIHTQTIQGPLTNHSLQAITPRTSSQSQIQPKIPSQQTQSAFVIPWHSIVPILTATSGPTSPPPSELSPPLSAPPLTNVPNTPRSTIEIETEDIETDQMTITAEDDDDVFEVESTENNVAETNSGNKRRSQSLSSLQSNNKEPSLTKVRIPIFITK